MAKYTFTKHPDPENRFDTDTVTVTTEADALSDLLQSFEYFLRGCGFHFKGEIEVVDDSPDEFRFDDEACVSLDDAVDEFIDENGELMEDLAKGTPQEGKEEENDDNKSSGAY